MFAKGMLEPHKGKRFSGLIFTLVKSATFGGSPVHTENPILTMKHGGMSIILSITLGLSILCPILSLPHH